MKNLHFCSKNLFKAGYLTSENGKTDRKQTQKGADKNTCVGKFKQVLK